MSEGITIPVWGSIVLSFSSYIYRGGRKKVPRFGEFYICLNMPGIFSQPYIDHTAYIDIWHPFHPQGLASRLGFRRYAVLQMRSASRECLFVESETKSEAGITKRRFPGHVGTTFKSAFLCYVVKILFFTFVTTTNTGRVVNVLENLWYFDLPLEIENNHKRKPISLGTKMEKRT